MCLVRNLQQTPNAARRSTDQTEATTLQATRREAAKRGRDLAPADRARLGANGTHWAAEGVREWGDT